MVRCALSRAGRGCDQRTNQQPSGDTRCARSEPSASSSFRPWRWPRASDGRPRRSPPTRSGLVRAVEPGDDNGDQGRGKDDRRHGGELKPTTTRDDTPSPATTRAASARPSPATTRAARAKPSRATTRAAPTRPSPATTRAGSQAAATARTTVRPPRPRAEREGDGGARRRQGRLHPCRARRRQGRQPRRRPRLGRLDQLQQEAERRSFGAGVLRCDRNSSTNLRSVPNRSSATRPAARRAASWPG